MPTLSTATDRTAALSRAAEHAALREPQEMAVTARGELVSFTSRLSDDAAQDLLQYCQGSFARSLWQQSHDRGLSAKQLAWAHKLSSELLEAAAEPAQGSDQPSQFEALFEAFQAARSKGAKRLTLRLEGINLKPNRELTALWVTSQTEKEMGDYGLKPKYLGKVTLKGLDSRLSDEVKETLMAAANDPLNAAIRYGKVSGECSCCGRELTDPRSIERGIGPICADKFGW
jgi:hypothetical protein